MTGCDTRLVTLDPEIFLAIRHGYELNRWVRLLNKVERGGENGDVLGITELAAVLESDGTCVLVQPQTMDAQRQYFMTEALEEQLGHIAPDWKYVVIECDVDGTDSAHVFEDKQAVHNEFDYIDFDDDPIRAFVDEQQVALRKIGQAYYG